MVVRYNHFCFDIGKSGTQTLPVLPDNQILPTV